MNADDFLERLKAGVKNRKILVYPGSDMDITIRVLSEAERQEAHFETEQYFKRRGIEISMVTVDAYEAEKSLRMLYKAITDADSKPIARSIERFRELITVDEKNSLVDEYMALEKDCSPNIAELSDSETDEILEDLKKNPATVGNVSSIVTARRLIICLADRLATLQTGNGSIS